MLRITPVRAASRMYCTLSESLHRGAPYPCRSPAFQNGISRPCSTTSPAACSDSANISTAARVFPGTLELPAGAERFRAYRRAPSAAAAPHTGAEHTPERGISPAIHPRRLRTSARRRAASGTRAQNRRTPATDPGQPAQRRERRFSRCERRRSAWPAAAASANRTGAVKPTSTRPRRRCATPRPR